MHSGTASGSSASSSPCPPACSCRVLSAPSVVAGSHADGADDDHEQDDRRLVVHEGGARTPVDGEVMEPVHDRSSCQHDDYDAGDEAGVELLAGVELAQLHVRVTAQRPEPAP